jgi:hypothetical protein
MIYMYFTNNKNSDIVISVSKTKEILGGKEDGNKSLPKRFRYY